MPDQQPHSLHYTQLRSHQTEFFFTPRYRLAAALIAIGASAFVVAVAYVSNHVSFIAVHVGSVLMLCAGHLLSRWPSNAGVEPVRIALMRWTAQVSLRFLVLLSLAYLERGPVAAIFLCFGLMIAHDLILLAERIQRGDLL